jgi:hypothetical protein
VKAALVTLRCCAPRPTKGSRFGELLGAIAGGVPHCYALTWPESFLVSMRAQPVRSHPVLVLPRFLGEKGIVIVYHLLP